MWNSGLQEGPTSWELKLVERKLATKLRNDFVVSQIYVGVFLPKKKNLQLGRLCLPRKYSMISCSTCSCNVTLSVVLKGTFPPQLWTSLRLQDK